MLDIGMSMEEIEQRSGVRGIDWFSNDRGEGSEKICAEKCYKEEIEGCRWLVIPGSDHGVLPGSRGKGYDDQVSYMQGNCLDSEVGGVRELLTLYVLYCLRTGEQGLVAV